MIDSIPLLLFIYTLAAFGYAYVLGFAVISLPIRRALDPGNKVETAGAFVRSFTLTLIECPACLGWWVGAWAGVIWGWGEPGKFATIFMLAFYTCGTNFILGRLTGLIREE